MIDGSTKPPVRLLRLLASCGFVAETGQNEFAPNALTETLATRITRGMTINWYVDSWSFPLISTANPSQL
jgi:hypothetical protein